MQAGNAAVADAIREKSEGILAELEKRDVRPFTVTSVEVQGTDVSHGGSAFTKEAKKAFLGVLRVKADFPELGEGVDRARWATALRTIQDTRRDQELHALYAKDTDGNLVVREVYPKKPNHAEAALRHRSIVGSITGALLDSPHEFALHDLAYDEERSEFDLTLLQRRTLDVGSADLWKAGARFTFTDMSFTHRSFFERLVCSNGMSTPVNGFRSRVDQKRHNITKIAEVVRRNIVEGDDALNDLVRAAVGHLRVRNASIAELQWMRGAFKKALKEDEAAFQRMDAMYFDEDHLYRAYGTSIEDQTQRWRQSADSGVNCYDLFNLMTWIASHPPETGIVRSSREALEIQIAASNLLFKNPLDLEDVAPRVDVPQRRLPEMN